MGTRSVQGFALLVVFLLGAILIQSCNKEPKPIAIDISQPTQHKPPIELWRKRVVTKPPTEAKRDKLMENHDWDKLAEIEGWTLTRSPIVLPDGGIYCITENESIPIEQSSSESVEKKKAYRVVKVSPSGIIDFHKEFEWDRNATIVVDPVGEYLAFVAQDTCVLPESKAKESVGDKSIIALDFDLNVCWKAAADSASLETVTFAASRTKFAWYSHEYYEKDGEALQETFICVLDRDGSNSWQFQLPNDNPFQDHIFSSVSISETGEVFACQSDNSVFAISATGQQAWIKQLDFSGITHPLILHDGRLAVTGDRFNMVEYVQVLAEMMDVESWFDENTDFSDPESFENSPMKKEMDEYTLKEENRKGFLTMLSTTGEISWERKLPKPATSGPIAIGTGKLLVCFQSPEDEIATVSSLRDNDQSCHLCCFSIAGETLWEKVFPTYLSDKSIQVVDSTDERQNIILAAGNDGNLYALDEAGELLWVISGTNIDRFSLAVGLDGRIYVVADGELVCYQMS